MRLPVLPMSRYKALSTLLSQVSGGLDHRFTTGDHLSSVRIKTDLVSPCTLPGTLEVSAV